MSDGITDTDNRHAVVRLQFHRAAATIFLTALVIATPLVKLDFLQAVGVGLVSALVAYWFVERGLRTRKEIDIAAQYKAKATLSDCAFTDRIYIGHGMDFIEYRQAFEKREAEIGRLTPEERKAIHNNLAKTRMQPVYMTDDDATHHVFICASTGGGKTELFKSIILESVIKRGAGALIFDAKGDEKLITHIVAMAEAHNRGEDVLFINFDRPDFSHTYNPLLYGSTRQIVSTLMKLFDRKGEQFFRDISRGALTAAITAIRAQPTHMAFNFTDLLVLFSNYYELDRLYRNIPMENPDREVVGTFLKRYQGQDRDGHDVVNTQLYAQHLTGLAQKMMDFSHSEYRPVLNDYSPDIELKSAILSNKIIVVVIPALSDKEGVEAFGKLFLGDFARAVGQIQQERQKPALPFFAFLDEYPSFADPDHIELWQQARSANVSLWPAVQGKGFMSKVAPFFFENLVSNCWHQVFFDIRDPDSRDHATRLAGQMRRRYRQDTHSENFSSSASNASTGAIRDESRSHGVSSGTREQLEDIIQAGDFSMSEGNAIILGKHSTLRMVLPMVRFERDVPRLEQIKFSRQERHNVNGLNLMSESMKRTDAHYRVPVRVKDTAASKRPNASH